MVQGPGPGRSMPNLVPIPPAVLKKNGDKQKDKQTDTAFRFIGIYFSLENRVPYVAREAANLHILIRGDVVDFVF